MRPLLLLLLLLPLQSAYDYLGYKLIRFPANKEIAAWLENLEEGGFDVESDERRILVDVWAEPSKNKDTADVLVAPEFYETMLTMLKAKGVEKITLLEGNIEKIFRREKRALATAMRRRKREADSAEHFDVENYHSYDEMADFMRKLAKERADLVTLLNVTTTSEGRTLYGVLISRRSADSPVKPAIFVDAGIHAREWIAPAAALYMIHKLVYSYGTDPSVTKTLNKFDWYIVPQANPDGYEYSRLTDRLWRKTRSRNTTVNRWCVGADANRNWGYRWGEAGANRQPCSNIYAGSHPFSEPEIAGLRDLITWNIPQLIVYASLHSYGQLLLSPWGYTSEKTENYIDQRNAAKAAVVAMRNATGANYSYGTIAELMYPASGTSIDYMQHRGVPYIFGVELRPLDLADSYAFTLPPTYIKSTGEEMLAGLVAVGDYAVVHQRL